MIATCTPDFFERVRGFGLESELPVFVVGLPRSGTTLVEQILASHSRVFGAGEIKLGSDTLAALGDENADFIEDLGRLDGETARRLAARHLERLARCTPPPCASWTKCRRITCFSAPWQSSFRGRNSSTAAATCATWPSPAG